MWQQSIKAGNILHLQYGVKTGTFQENGVLLFFVVRNGLWSDVRHRYEYERLVPLILCISLIRSDNKNCINQIKEKERL